MTKKNEEVFDASTGEIYKPLFRSPYINLPPREILQFDPAEKRTKDEFKDDCDVNKIWANYVRTGRMDQLQKAKGFYADLTNVPTSYQESLNLVVRTREMFDNLPSDIRNAYGNDVQLFMEAAQEDPDALFDVLKTIQPIDGTAATPVAPPKAEPPPASPDAKTDPLPNPAS